MRELKGKAKARELLEELAQDLDRWQHYGHAKRLRRISNKYLHNKKPLKKTKGQEKPMTMRMARTARKMYREGKGQSIIAAYLEVNQGRVSDAVTGKTWREQ